MRPRSRSQAELEMMTVQDQYPQDNELKCVLKDGSQISMLEGLQGMLGGLAIAAGSVVLVILVLL